MTAGTISMQEDDFMGPVAAAGVRLMGEVLSYQNSLRDKQTTVALSQTVSGSDMAQCAAAAVQKAGQLQADSYYLQAGQSIGSALCDGVNAGVNQMGVADRANLETCRVIGEKTDAQEALLAQAKPIKADPTKVSAGEVLAVPVLSDDEQAQLEETTRMATGKTSGEELTEEDKARGVAAHSLIKEDQQEGESYTEARDRLEGSDDLETRLSERIDANAAKKAAEDAQAKKTAQIKQDASRIKNTFESTGDQARDQAALEYLASMHTTKPDGSPAVNLDGSPVTELDEFKTKLQDKIDTNRRTIAGKQTEISNDRQQRSIIFNLMNQVQQAGFNSGQAVVAGERAAQEADQKLFEFGQNTSGAVLQAASAAMNNCNETQSRVISELTGALKQVMGG